MRAHALALLEQTIGWAVGCAWTNLVLASTSLASFPTLEVTSWDLLVALSLTLLAVCWFFFTRPPAGWLGLTLILTLTLTLTLTRALTLTLTLPLT